jgi:hypothetical protein
MLLNNDVIVLLGAGCSFKARIPTSDKMLTELHDLLEQNLSWKKFHPLYCCLRGLILRADALLGKFNESFNIERLVASLGEIESLEKNVLSPFVNSLHPDLEREAGENRQLVTEFRQRIVERLKDWVQVAEYYRSLFDFAAAYTYPLRVFTLNYDLCLEKNTPPEKTLERGFDRTTHLWDWRRFEPKDTDSVSIYYYKMHGSIDWQRDVAHGNVVKDVENTPLEPDLIFGTMHKLYPNDPYLFYAYELRQYSLLAKVILVIGYSFADEHINRILRQALENDSARRIVAVMPHPDRDGICSRLGESVKRQVIFEEGYAEIYLKTLTPDHLTQIAGIHVDTHSDPFAAEAQP